MVNAIAFLVSHAPSGARNYDQSLKGTVHLSEVDGATKIDVDIEGLTPGEHGFHIHEFGDQTNGCLSAGGHYNPFAKTHGAPTSTDRHVGDLGNITVDQTKKVKTTIFDKQVKLSGEHSVIGRSIVVHALPDDLGLKGDAESLKTGNAGARVLCGVIGTV